MSRFKMIEAQDIVVFKKNIKKAKYNCRVRIIHMTAAKYLDICKMCYEAVYADQNTRNVDSETLYLDGRSISRKDAFFGGEFGIDKYSAEQFKRWTEQGDGYSDHSYEILFGRVEFRCLMDDDGYYFFVNDHNGGINVEDSCLAILIYNEIIRQGFPISCGKFNMNRIEERLKKGLIYYG